MKKIILLFFAFAVTFVLGFAFKSVTTKSVNSQQSIKKVTGIGGIFFKWRQGSDTSKKGFTQWSPFNEKTRYFEPSTKDFMINYRIENVETLIEELKKSGVTVVDTIESYEYGKFVHILDPEGNKIELWEPNDIEFEKLGEQIGAKTTK